MNSVGKYSEAEINELIESAESDEDFAHIQRLLDAIDNADTTTAAQRATLEQLTQQSAAHLLSVTSRHLRDHQPARNSDGTYHGPDLVQWKIDRAIADAKKNWERRSDVNLGAKDRQALARAIKLEEEAKGVQDTYVKREDVLREFMAMAADVRTELEALPKLVANDSPPELRELQQREIKGQVRQILRRLANRGKRIDSTD